MSANKEAGERFAFEHSMKAHLVRRIEKERWLGDVYVSYCGKRTTNPVTGVPGGVENCKICFGED